ncbi:ABC transporter ATP-binding protein [uncultured Desulfobacter sp.]|uniref:ATP-binding cassette domain-containing protein n=1 Tax=uncultured Desulfobacter sp. TaxID=240139 RepID=UPI002AAC2752|nr:ABC transporter ATP-binding protein [uncultured Desulfobacter sp.]
MALVKHPFNVAFSGQTRYGLASLNNPLEKDMRFECRGLTFTYPQTDKPVLENLNFSMAAPGFNAVFGPSGVGKTSFARILAGGTSGPGGNALIYEDIATILYSYNQERLPGWSCTGHHLEKVCPKGKSDLKKELVKIFKVDTLLGSRFSQLSMGQQNRMNLIRYLIQDFDLLILDESLANVDEALRETIVLAIKEMFPAKLFLYISHNLMEVAKFCKDILVLTHPGKNRGAVVVQGQNYETGYTSDPRTIDRSMLEIMNAV